MGDKRMETTMDNNVIDLSLSIKKKIRIDNDDNRIIELNTSDMGIIERINGLADKMVELSNKFVTVKYDDDLEERIDGNALAEEVKLIDSEMREIIDDLFQSPISDVCVPDGTMFDMFNGEFMYEIVIQKLLNLYADNIHAETEKTMNRIHKHTDKYIPQDHKKKS